MQSRFKAAAKHLLPWIILFAVYTLLVEITLFCARFINDPLDRAILLALQPDHYVPILDEFIILVTDFSVYVFGLTALTWQITYLICRNNPVRLRRATRAWQVMAIVFGIYHALGVVFYKHGVFWWGKYEYNGVFLVLGLILFLAFWYGAKTFAAWDAATQRRWSRVFWLTLLTVCFSNFHGENYIKKTIGRPRPFAPANAPWNEEVRKIKDEVVCGGPSYISGHASSLFALLTPTFWAVRRKRVKAGLFGWASVHAYTRVYTAAHFPYCAFMGSLFGFAVGTLVFMLFRRWACPDLEPSGQAAA